MNLYNTCYISAVLQAVKIILAHAFRVCEDTSHATLGTRTSRKNSGRIFPPDFRTHPCSLTHHMANLMFKLCDSAALDLIRYRVWSVFGFDFSTLFCSVCSHQINNGNILIAALFIVIAVRLNLWNMFGNIRGFLVSNLSFPPTSTSPVVSAKSLIGNSCRLQPT